jgi:NitT/TauT family transport system substrate-binding protein
MADSVPFVDCCHVDEEDRVLRPGVSPFLIEPNPLKRPLKRRRSFKGLAAVSVAAAATFAEACGSGSKNTNGGTSPSGAPAGRVATSSPVAKLESIDLPYCSQILCGVPLETAVKHGFFEEQGLKVKLVYMKGGALAVQALVNGSADWVGAAMDVIVSAHAAGQNPVMVASLSSLPFFALVTAPNSKVQGITDLKGKRIGIANVNTSDHLLARYLLEKNGISDAASLFAPLGPNLYDGLRTGQVDAGMVQEPALTQLTQQGSRVLVNFMKQADVKQYLGGPYQFVGLNTRPDVLQKKPETLQKLVRALTKANAWVRSNPGSEIIKNLPDELVAGGDLSIFARSLDQVKSDLYPDTLKLDAASVQRVIDVQKQAGPFDHDVTAAQCFSNQLIGA